MAEFTKEHFDAFLHDRFEPLSQKLDTTAENLDRSADTVERTAAMLSALVDGLKDLPVRLDRIEATLQTHSKTLDALLKNTETWRVESAAIRNALDRHEDWIREIAKRLGMRLDK